MPSPSPKNKKKKDEIRMVILMIGVIGGLLILFGLYKSLSSLTASDLPSTTNKTDIPCLSCITEAQNGQHFTYQVSEKFTLNLPQNLYPKENLLVINAPVDALKAAFVQANNERWGVVFTAMKKGTDEIVVKSSSRNLSDFHVSIVVK